MNFKRKGSGVKAGLKACCLAIFCLACGPFVFAQAPPVPPGGTVVASGLEGPRGMTFGPDGLLYFAEAGLGGTQAVPQGLSECARAGRPVSWRVDGTDLADRVERGAYDSGRWSSFGG